MNIEMMGCEKLILGEIANPKLKRRDVSQTYAWCLRASDHQKIDYGKINAAIMERWSYSALEWIKERAHSGKCFEPRPERSG